MEISDQDTWLALISPIVHLRSLFEYIYGQQAVCCRQRLVSQGSARKGWEETPILSPSSQHSDRHPQVTGDPPTGFLPMLGAGKGEGAREGQSADNKGSRGTPVLEEHWACTQAQERWGCLCRLHTAGWPQWELKGHEHLLTPPTCHCPYSVW